MGLKPLGKLVLVGLILGIIVGLWSYFQKTGVLSKIAPQGKSSYTATSSNDKDALKVGVVTWGGYAGGQYFNRGFKASEESMFYKDYGIKVEFIVNDDFVPSREAWKADKVDVLWGTADSFPIEAASMIDLEPKIIFQADWSRGGDAIVVRRGITKVSDLKGKKIAFAFGTPSHTFLLWLLKAGDMTQNDITPVETDSAVQAATFFKSGNVDAAVVWSPDDEDCITKVSGSTILKSTKEASNIIADIFFVKKKFLDSHKEVLSKFVEGFLRGAAELNSSNTAKHEAAKILSQGLNVDEEFAYKAINNARLATYGDNLKFFGLDTSSNSVTGEHLYTTMGQEYQKLNIAKGRIPGWRMVADVSIINSITSLNGREHSGEGVVKFTAPTPALITKEAFSTKRVTITFPTGAYMLDENSKYIIQSTFVDIAKSFSNARVRIEGNTDTIGSYQMNKALSYKRAKAVADFLVRDYGFDRNRFIIVGNGSDKPIMDNDTESGRSKNRRTDFELISNQ